MATDPVFFRGISFPFRKSETEFPASATDDDLIKESLIQLILTRRGDRVMRPDLGSGALGFVFEPNNAALGDHIRAEIYSVVGRYEPRVIIHEIRVDQLESEVLVTIDFVITTTRTASTVNVSLPST